ncbi:MAG: hypothetical protein ACM3L6_05625 [Deltaproteobacteria bacterium]
MTPLSRRKAFLLACAALPGCFWATPAARGQEEQKIEFPAKTWHEGQTWHRDPAFRDEEIYREADLDADGEKEVVLGYVGSYKPPSEDEKEEGPRMFELPKQAPPTVVEHRVFYKIFDRDAGGHWECVRTLTGLEHPGEVHVVTLAPGAPAGLLIVSGGGAAYKEIDLYQWQEGGYRLKDSRGTREPVSVETSPELRLRLGDRLLAWDPRTQAWIER